MTTDRELLELAAKAAGISVIGLLGDGLAVDGLASMRWSPLTDDGDALRLAVKLGMRLFVYPEGESSVFADTMHEPIHWVVTRKDDACLATRRAIVLAAAEIGRAMP